MDTHRQTGRLSRTRNVEFLFPQTCNFSKSKFKVVTRRGLETEYGSIYFLRKTSNHLCHTFKGTLTKADFINVMWSE